MSKPETIFQQERLDKILDLLEDKERILTNDLAEELNTSPTTIRKDLTILEGEGLLKRTHGGAVKTKRLFPGLALSEKAKIRIDEKLRLVKEAAKLVEEGDTIILDSGSTTSLLAKEIKTIKNLTVITNAVNVVSELLSSSARIIVIGGLLVKDSLTLVGPLADNTLQMISSGKLFMGVDGIDYKIGLTTPNLQEAHTTSVMMSVSGQTILMADESKFDRRSLGVISPIESLDVLITTKNLSDKEKELFSNRGVTFKIV